MATCREIITAAYRRAGILGRAATPSAQDGSRGLEVLQGWYEGLIGSGAFGRQNDAAISADYTAAEQDRIILTAVTAVQVTLPDTVADADSGVTRPIRDGSIITVADLYSDDRFAYVYDSAYGAWTPIYALTLDNWAPLSARHRRGIVGNLAVLLADESGLPVSPVLALEARSGLAAMLMRTDAPARPVRAEYF